MNYIALTDFEVALLKQSLLKAEVSPLATLTEAANIRDLHIKIDEQIESSLDLKK